MIIETVMHARMLEKKQKNIHSTATCTVKVK